MVINIVCKECGKPQKKNQEKSNSNWDYFDGNVLCECGGEFEVKIVELK